MAKKLSIPVNLSDEYTVIAIACHLKEYRISFAINQSLRIQLKRYEDLLIEEAKAENSRNYALYSYDDQDHRCFYFLLANHHPQGKLLPSLKQSDYFLILSQLIPKDDVNRIILNIRNIHGVLMAYQVYTNEVRDMDLLLNDLEMHLMTA